MDGPLEAKYKVSLLLDDALRSLRQLRRAYTETLGAPVDAGNAAAPAVKQAQDVATARRKAAKEVTQAETAEQAVQAQNARKAREAERAADKRANDERREADRKARALRADDAKRARAEANLSRQVAPQITDIAVGLTTGQSPLMVALQQGGQLKDLYGGLGNLGRAMLGALTPLRVVLGGVAAGVVGLASAAVQGYRESDKLNKTLALTGNTAGLTAGTIEASAKRIAAAQSASISSTREALVAGASLGTFTSATLNSAARAATVLSKLTGQTAAEQIADFKAMGDGVAEWAAKQNRAYNFLTSAEFAHVRSLEAAGREQEAMRLVLDKLSGTIEQRAAPAIGTLERLWKGAAKGVSDFWDSIKAIGRDDTLEERIERAAARVEQARRVVAGGASIGPYGGRRDGADQFKQAQTELDALNALRNSDLLRQAERGINLQTQQDGIKQQSQSFQDALAGIVQAGIQRRLAEQQAGIDAEQLVVERANARGLLSEEQYQTSLAEIDARRARAEVSSARRLLEEERGRKYGTPEAVKAQEAKLEQLQAQIITAESRARTAAARPAQIADATLLEDARDSAQQWADAWRQAFEQTQAFAQENAQTNAQRLRDPVERAKAEGAAAVAAMQRQRAELQRDIQLQIDKAAGREEDAARRAAETENEGESERQSAIAFSQQQQRVELQRQLNLLLREAAQAEADRRDAAELGSTRSQFAEKTDALRLKEQQLDDDVRRGRISVEEAERAKTRAREESIPVLERLIALAEELAKKGTDADRGTVDGMKREVGDLRKKSDELREVRSAIGSGFSQMFTDVATGAKSALDAVKDFTVGVLKAMLNVIGQRLGEKLADSILPKGGSGSGGSLLSFIGSAVANLFQHHDGGMVGAGGRPRQVGLGTVLAAAAAGLPRYHSGGIVGLGSNEELAVLKKREEVLTEDDPRHASNYRGSPVNVGGIKVAVSVGADGGDVDAQGLGHALGEAIEGGIYRVLAKESREGGMLNRGRR